MLYSMVGILWVIIVAMFAWSPFLTLSVQVEVKRLCEEDWLLLRCQQAHCQEDQVPRAGLHAL